MTLQTQRLILRVLTSVDARAYFELSQNEGFRRFQISNYKKDSIEDSLLWISIVGEYHRRNGFGIYGVFKKEDSSLIGLGALKYLEQEGKSPVELMYRLSDQNWGKGYGSEIAVALIKLAFVQLKLPALVATVDPENTPSKKILANLGFQFQKFIEIENIKEELHILLSERLKPELNHKI